MAHTLTREKKEHSSSIIDKEAKNTGSESMGPQQILQKVHLSRLSNSVPLRGRCTADHQRKLSGLRTVWAQRAEWVALGTKVDNPWTIHSGGLDLGVTMLVSQ